MLLGDWSCQVVTILVLGDHWQCRGVPMASSFAISRICGVLVSVSIVAAMSNFEGIQKSSKKSLATRRAGEIRRQRIAEVRERENRVEGAVIRVLTAKLVIEEGHIAAAEGVQELKRLGETNDSIAGLCEMTVAEVRAALSLDHPASVGH
jgi:hypothetical protein